jgi:hypothetical protein
MPHNWKKSIHVEQDDGPHQSHSGHRSLVWRCTKCDATTPRTRGGWESTPPTDSYLIATAHIGPGNNQLLRLGCDEIIAHRVMES